MPLDDYRIIESTLREGEQFVGASFTTAEKVEIARLLDAFGVECLELTSPCASPKSFEDIETIAKLMCETSHCGLGQTAANPILSSMRQFPLTYKSRLCTTSFEPAFDLDASLEEARQATGRNDPGAHIEGGGV